MKRGVSKAETGWFGLKKLFRKVFGSAQGIFLSIDKLSVSQDDDKAFFELSGWAFGRNGSAVTCQAKFQTPDSKGKSSDLEILVSDSRLDVAKSFSLKRDKIGFSLKTEWSAVFGSAKKGQVTLSFSDGLSHAVIGPLEVSQGQDGVVQKVLTRANYGEVWNSEAMSMSESMIAVAGYDDLDEFQRSGMATAELLSEKLKISREDVVLEIGCGVGRIGKYLSPLCKKWIGCDVSSHMLEYARIYLEDLDNVELRELTGYSLAGIEDSSVDKLYCSTVFMHLDEWDRYSYVKEAFRVLRPGGICYVDNLDLDSELGWAEFLRLSEYEPSKRPANISKSSTIVELKCYLDRAGFKDISTKQRSSLYVDAVGVKP